MPVLKPKNKENEDEFIQRCMNDETMKKEFSNSRQRAAICYDTWRKDKRVVNERVMKLLASIREKKVR